jgi:hypothetical protein
MRAASLLALAPVAGCLALGALAARAALVAAPASIGTDLAQPLAVVTGWHGFGVTVFALLAGSIGLAALALAFTLPRLAAQGRPGGVLTIVVAAAAALAACFAWPVVFSSDTYAYAAYGDLALHGVDPYRAVPPGFHDPLVDAARWQWGGVFPLCVYGPAFVALASFVVTATGGRDAGLTLLGLRLVASLAFLASAAALHVALEGVPAGRRFAATCAYALNPVALWSVAEGHNDALALLCVLGGAALARRARPALGGLAVGLSVLLKAPGPLLGAALLLDAGLPAGLRRRFGFALAIGTALGVCVALPLQLAALTAVGTHGRYAPVGSLSGLIGPLPALAIVLVIAVAGVRRLRRAESDGYPWLGLATWLAVPAPYPWYALWVLPAVAAAPSSRPGRVLWAVTILAVLRYLPDAAGNMAYDPRILAVAALAPLVLLFVRMPARFSDMKVAAHP